MSVSNTIVYFNGDLETHRDVATFLWSAWTFLDPATGQSIVQIGNDPKTFKSLCVWWPAILSFWRVGTKVS